MERNWNIYSEGSCVISCGRTRVLCTATVEDKVPPFLRGQGKGWVTGERCITLDCDVIQADGGTRTASITGAYVALVDALRWLREQGAFEKLPLKSSVAAVSVGKVRGRLLLDLCYEEDSTAEVDFNVVKNGQGDLASAGIHELTALQRRTLQWDDGEVR